MHDDTVRVELSRVMIQEKDEQQFIHLREQGGERSFPIVIGIHEAAEINRKLQKFQSPRPMTHDLVFAVLDALNWRLTRVVITELRGTTFYAILVITDGEEERIIDSRPSDAVALAVHHNTPIFVNRALLDQMVQG